MKFPLLILLLISGSAQTPEPHLFFREGRFESLVESCKKADTIHDGLMPQENQGGAGICFGFINGLIDGLTFADAARSGGNLKRLQYSLCVPEDASGAQLAKVIVKYGNDHPEELHQAAAVEVVFALKSAFVCQ